MKSPVVTSFLDRLLQDRINVEISTRINQQIDQYFSQTFEQKIRNNIGLIVNNIVNKQELNQYIDRYIDRQLDQSFEQKVRNNVALIINNIVNRQELNQHINQHVDNQINQTFEQKVQNNIELIVNSEYIHIIDSHKRFSYWNTLGLFRSLVETKKLDLNQKIEIKEDANKQFQKAFEFLQLKDPSTYFYLKTLGENLTVVDKEKIWKDIRVNQEKILKEKKIKHRNFGEYSKHNCGYEQCPYNELMIKQGSLLAEGNMHFNSDKSKTGSILKSKSYRKQRKRMKKLIHQEFVIS